MVQNPSDGTVIIFSFSKWNWTSDGDRFSSLKGIENERGGDIGKSKRHLNWNVGNEQNNKEKKDNGKELQFYKADKSDELQTLPVFDDKINIPKLPDKFDKEVKIKKDVLLDAVNKIFFAISFESSNDRFIYWFMKYNKDEAQFVTGSGMRFATLKLSGKNFIEAKDKGDFIFHRDHTPVLLSVLKLLPVEYISIKQNDKSMVITAGSTTITVMGFEPNIRRYDETIFFNKPKKCKFITKVSDWVYPMKGIRATYNTEVKKMGSFHEAKLEVDAEKKTLVVQANTQLKSSRKIEVKDLENKEPNIKKYDFKVLSQFFAEMPDYFNASGYCQIEIGEKELPIVLHDYAKDKVSDVRPSSINEKTGLTEQYSLILSIVNDE